MLGEGAAPLVAAVRPAHEAVAPEWPVMKVIHSTVIAATAARTAGIMLTSDPVAGRSATS